MDGCIEKSCGLLPHYVFANQIVNSLSEPKKAKQHKPSIDPDEICWNKSIARN